MKILQSYYILLLFICLFATPVVLFATPISPNNGPDELSFIIGSESATMGEEKCVDIMACQFNLVGFQFTISWDSTILRYSRVINPNLPFFLQPIYRDFTDQFRIAWINENISSSISVPDSSAVFTLCFTPKRPGVSSIYFDRSTNTPLHPEFIDLEGETNANLYGGSITVLGCSPVTASIVQTICEGSSYEGYSQSGQYTDAFFTNRGCDSTRFLQLNVVPSLQSNITQTICQGTSYQGYSQSGQYTDRFRSINGCDSTRVLQLTIASPIQTTLRETICEGENYGGRVQAGNYIDTYSSRITGCDSIRTLELTVLPVVRNTINQTLCAGTCLNILGADYCNAGTYVINYSGYSGCDSVVTYVLNVAEQVTGNSSVQLCSGDSWVEAGNTLTLAGAYTFSYQSRAGCDSLHTLNLSFDEGPTNTNEIVTICEGENYGGRVQAGTYRDTYTNINGCDSVHTINLTILPRISSTFFATICEGQSYEGYSSGGQYQDSFTTSSGCDSIRILNLTVGQSIQTVLDQTICEGQSYEGYTNSGRYENTFITSSGCDSTRILNLTILSPIQTSLVYDICQGQSIAGYSSSGQYTDTFTAVNGCDSIRVINLTVAATITTNIEASICEGSTFAGYSVSGVYEDTFTSVSGCDSTRIVSLKVAPVIETIISTSICEGDNFEGFTNAGTYTNIFQSSFGCDSIRTIELMVLPSSETIVTRAICEGENVDGFTAAGTYTSRFTSSNGCDSISVLNLSILPADDVNCSTTSTLDISAIATLNYYPNPIKTQLFLEWNSTSTATFSILDISGKTLRNSQPLQLMNTVDMGHYLVGVYYLKIDTAGRSYYAKLLKL